MANKIEFKIFGDAKNLEKGLASAKKSFSDLGRNAGIAFVGLTAAIAGTTEAARQQELSINQLNQALKNSGNFSESASKDLQDYAKSLQSITIFGDEVILKGQALIASFGFEGQVLKDLTKATLDLAQAKNMDLVAAADLVSKAVGSSTNALSRYGVEVEGVAGSSERAKSAVENITKLFGGQAEAAAQGLGANIQLKNSLGDLAETIGFALEPTIVSITKSLKQFVEVLNENPKIAQTAATFLLFGTAISGVLAAIGFLGSGVLSSIVIFGKLGTAISANITLLGSLAAVGAAAFVGWNIGSRIAELEQVQKLFDNIVRQLNLFSLASREADLEEAERINKIAVARANAVREANADRIAALEEEKNAQLEHEEAIRKLKAETAEFIKTNDEELKEIATVTDAEELQSLIKKFELERDALLEHLELKQQILETNGGIEAQQVEKFETEKAQIIDKYNKLIQQADKKTADVKNQTLEQQLTSLAGYTSRVTDILRQAGATTKGIELTNAIVQQAGAIMRAWNSAPFPANLIPVAITTAETGLILSKISSASFAVGSPNIPNDMLAQVHQGETIIPKTFAESIRAGELSLSGGGADGGSGVSLNFDGATFIGVTEDIVEQIFTKASEMTRNRTLISGVA